MSDPKHLPAVVAALDELADEKLQRLVSGRELQTRDEQALVIIRHCFPGEIPPTAAPDQS